MLKLLLNVTKRDEWSKYFNTRAQLPAKPLCVHLAARYNQVGIMKELKQMSKDGVLSLDERNGNNQTPLEMAVKVKNYQMVKCLYDARKTYSSNEVTSIIAVCLESDDEYDEAMQTQCLNFKFFQKILSDQGNINVRGFIQSCLQAERDEYFEYLLEQNDRFKSPFKSKDFWNKIGKICNPRMMKSMLNTNVKGFVFSELKNDSTYWTVFRDVCNNNTAYSKNHPRQSNAFRCFSLLLEREEIVNVLKQNQQAAVALACLIRWNKMVKIDYLFEMNDKLKWKLDFTQGCERKINAARNALQLAASLSNYEACKKLINTGWFDINYYDMSNKTPALFYCAQSKAKFYYNNVMECDNFKVFQLLLSIKGINIGFVAQNGSDLVTTLYKLHKDDYIDYLKEKVSGNDNDNDWKLDEVMIDNLTRKYKTVDALIAAIKKSDVKTVQSILALKSTQTIIKDVMNMSGLRNNGVVLHTCVKTMTGWEDKNPTTCANYRVFNLLLNQKGVDLGYCNVNGFNVWHMVFQSVKVSFLDLLVSKTTKSEWKIYFNTPVSRGSGRQCTHLALKSGDANSVVMLAKLKQMSMDKKFKDVIDMTCQNFHGHTVYYTVMSSHSYFYALKLLFDEKQDNRKYINTMITNVLQTRIGYDSKNPLQCENYQFFKILLNQSGIKGETVMQACVEQKRVEYLELLMKLNDKFEEKFTVDSLWIQLSDFYQCMLSFSRLFWNLLYLLLLLLLLRFSCVYRWKQVMLICFAW